MFAEYGLGLLAGALSTLSPCVLPLLPILAGTALTTHRLGPFALALGLGLSFTIIGILLAATGSVLGLDAVLLRQLAALLLLLFGSAMAFEPVRIWFSEMTTGFSQTGQPLLERISANTLYGQFLLGLVLGIVWSPCVGPTLGATITIASQGQNLANAAIVMAMFGFGTTLPLIAVGNLSQQTLLRYKSRLAMTGTKGRQVLGFLLIAVGILVITGLDKSLETWLLNVSPAWLTKLTISV